ncbi:MAG: hypothetical protein JWQ71_2704 [Pedosphaera sp.]|nr:hypothetical protein [Pedosphaera sp.]
MARADANITCKILIKVSILFYLTRSESMEKPNGTFQMEKPVIWEGGASGCPTEHRQNVKVSFKEL